MQWLFVTVVFFYKFYKKCVIYIYIYIYYIHILYRYIYYIYIIYIYIYYIYIYTIYIYIYIYRFCIVQMLGKLFRALVRSFLIVIIINIGWCAVSHPKGHFLGVYCSPSTLLHFCINNVKEILHLSSGAPLLLTPSLFKRRLGGGARWGKSYWCCLKGKLIDGRHRCTTRGSEPGWGEVDSTDHVIRHFVNCGTSCLQEHLNRNTLDLHNDKHRNFIMQVSWALLASYKL